jgi:hypothetical protein
VSFALFRIVSESHYVGNGEDGSESASRQKHLIWYRAAIEKVASVHEVAMYNEVHIK